MLLGTYFYDYPRGSPGSEKVLKIHRMFTEVNTYFLQQGSHIDLGIKTHVIVRSELNSYRLNQLSQYEVRLRASILLRLHAVGALDTRAQFKYTVKKIMYIFIVFVSLLICFINSYDLHRNFVSHSMIGKEKNRNICKLKIGLVNFFVFNS